MSLSVVASVNRLLSCFTAEERSNPSAAPYFGRVEECVGALNGALQEFHGTCPKWCRPDGRGALLNPPTQCEIAVIHGSTLATISTGWQAWMAGCTIRISGSAFDNQIRNDQSAVILKIPHDGETGTVTATVYQDSVTCESDVLAITGTMRANGIPIGPLIDPKALLGGRHCHDYGFDRIVDVEPVTGNPGIPTGHVMGYYVDTWSPVGSALTYVRIRVEPAPNVQTVLEYECKVMPKAIVDSTSVDDIPIPFEFTESIFFPIAKKILMECPFYRHSAADQAVMTAYANAKKLLQAMNPRKRSGIQFRPLY